ncbi:SDR family oxidoreductase [Streptomyces sp. NPDC059788]|uniref:SDR family oxidoreductase n=1 Tax=Streptomyces sp. NPDC059788 TaxID=3346948 RepID=UPI00364BB5B1
MFEDRTVIVSGVGPGLGRSIALRAARSGADVVLAARTGTRLAEVAAEIEAGGRRALAVPTDITDEASAAHLVETAVATFGRVDALVHNAFAAPPLVELGEADPDDIRAGFETNVVAALRLTRLCTPALARSRGAVVMINSAVIRHSRPRFGAYRMAKAALLSAARSLAAELGQNGIRVNTVAPGYIWADALREGFGHVAAERGVTTQQVYDEIAETLDLRRLPEPDEVADAVLFLASSAARAVTGQCLDVNAGEFHH